MSNAVLYLLILYSILIVRYTFTIKSSKRGRSMSKPKLDVLLQIRDDARDELKQRIAQRDNFAIQYTVITLALLTLTFSQNGEKVSFVALALLPLVSLFYSMLIDSSYRVHERLVEYLNAEIEPRISKEFGNKIMLWEQYCDKVRHLECDNREGGRNRFFHDVALLTPIIVFIIANYLLGITVFFSVYSAVCLCLAILVVYKLNYYNSYTGLNKLAFCDYERREQLTDEPKKAILLDRDGTLHVDKVMTHKLKDLELLPGAASLVQRAHQSGYKVIILTNQSAIGKGYYSSLRMHLFNLKLRRKLKYVDAIYYCPHTKEANCHCRKPDTGMIERAAQHYNLDLAQCIMVGDRMSDIIAAEKAGIQRRIFVTTGIYATSYKDEPHFEDVEHETVDTLSQIQLN
ncbi:MAG: D-glycero-alpha-D-manno-heptose-1,7-bisphosphate 7-phosphatase [Lachnospiraceae bacterium]